MFGILWHIDSASPCLLRADRSSEVPSRLWVMQPCAKPPLGSCKHVVGPCCCLSRTNKRRASLRLSLAGWVAVCVALALAPGCSFPLEPEWLLCGSQVCECCRPAARRECHLLLPVAWDGSQLTPCNLQQPPEPPLVFGGLQGGYACRGCLRIVQITNPSGGAAPHQMKAASRTSMRLSIFQIHLLHALIYPCLCWQPSPLKCQALLTADYLCSWLPLLSLFGGLAAVHTYGLIMGVVRLELTDWDSGSLLGYRECCWHPKCCFWNPFEGAGRYVWSALGVLNRC